MLSKYFFQFNIGRKEFLEVLVLVLNALTWYFATLGILDNISSNRGFTTTEILLISTFYNIAIIGAGVVGSILCSRMRRLRLLYSWMLLGTVISLFPAFFNKASVGQVAGVFFSMGIVFGFGLPSCLAYFADHTLIDNRGRVSGVICLITFFSFLVISVAFSMLDLVSTCISTAIWRALGLILIWLLKPKEKIVALENVKQRSFASVLRDRSFLFYLIPWLVFWLVDRSEESLLRTFLKSSFGSGFYSFSQLTSLIVSGISVLFAGTLSDLAGRKRIVISGFVALGLAYAVIGLAPMSLFSWYFWIVADGMAWGIFFVTFFLILWGDLSSAGVREKYYLLGIAPFFLTSVIQLFLTPYIALIPLSSTFSLAAFFLFLAVLPLMYAPETLPEKKIRLRQLRGYAEAAKKVREKYLKKGGAG